MKANAYKQKMGWLPDYPDFRDYTPSHELVAPQLSKVKLGGMKTAGQPAKVDLRSWCSAVEDQGELGSCTANAGVGLVEYFERRAFGKHIEASRLFLYKVTRNLLQSKGDTGAFIRTTMGALTLFGVPPEDYWKYDISKFDQEPPAFCYAFAHNYQMISYFRFDPPTIAKAELLKRIKSYLAGGIPAIFGFTVYDSIDQASSDGRIPYPASGEKMVGGHAVTAVGYDDKLKISNGKKQGTATTGAFLIRNSWGAEWGEQGYGWLPYQYLLSGLAIDWWSLIKSEWVDSGAFGVGSDQVSLGR